MDTRVSVVERSRGSGSVAVTVALDGSAVRSLGGETALARQLQYADLQSAGWNVSGPTPGAGGGATVTVSHGFSSGAELSQLVSDIAGSGPPGTRPFRLSLSDGGGFFTNRTVVRGAVDLRCGLDCFGDPGLKAALGGSLGVAPQPLEGAAGQTADQVFHFALAVRLPGHPKPSSGSPSVGRDGTLTWAPALGSSTAVGAVSESVDWGHVILVSVLAGLVVVGGGVGAWWLRRRRRRKASAPGDVDLTSGPPGEQGSPAAAPGEAAADPWSWPKV